MIVWATPLAFLLFLLLAAMLAWRWIRKEKLRPTIQFSAIADFAKTHKTWRMRLTQLPTILKVLALVMAIIALARPQRADEKIKRSVEGIDIMMSLDISDSMLIEDMTPENRMEASKEMIKRFIQGRSSDRIGLVVFAGESYTRVPLTLDYDILLKSLAAVQTAKNMKMGTAIGVSLANAVARLRESTAKTRVIILLTDGENNTGTIDPLTALNIAKGFGIKIYTIGVGKDGQAQLPRIVEDRYGKKIKTYQPIHSAVNEELLSQMANETGGKFYRVITTANLEAVFKDIDQLEKSKVDENKYTRYAELYEPYLQVSALLYLLAFILGHTFLRRGP